MRATASFLQLTPISMHGLTLNIIKSMQRTRGWTTTDSGEILGLVALTIYLNVVKVP